MQTRPLLLPGRTSPAFTPRSLLSILFRRRQLIAISFFAVFIPVLLAVALLPPEYESETSILVQRQRFDPVITSSSATQTQAAELSQLERLDEQDIDSEIDLLQSPNVLREVVVKLGLWKKVPRWRSLLPIPLASDDKRIARSVIDLRKHLTVDPPNKSNMVTVHYRSHHPQQSAQVLQALVNVYMEKHLEVHRPAGSTEFFSQDVERNRRALEDAENRLVNFTQTQGVVAAGAEDATLLQKIADFDASLQTTQAQIASTKHRIADLEGQRKTVQPRITTSVKTASLLLENLKSTLYSLELKRTELLTKYQPTYRLVKDVDKQIAETRSAIAKAQAAPTAESTTDQDPVYMWVNSELAKARSDLAALRATATETEQTLRSYRERAVHLQELATQQEDLTRNVKAAEDAYMGSLRQQSQARLSEALDRSRIMNVAVAEAASVPALPTMSALLKLALGFALAVMVALGLAFAVDYWDPSFRTPDEVEAFLELPVLAAIPHPNALPDGTGDAPSHRLAA